jgi:OmpA-OmpF porin, OOP family
MRLSKPLYWLITLLWFLAGIWWYAGCSKCTSCTTSTPEPAITTNNLSLPGFSVSDGNWALNNSDNLKFGLSGNTPVYSASITKSMDSLVAYAKANPGKTITITGHYVSNEKNNTTFENLGFARAEEIKKWLVAKGVSDKNVLTKSQLDANLVLNPADTLIGGISMAINAIIETPAAAKDDLFAPRTVYFNTGKNVLNVDADLKKYLQNAAAYLQAHTDKKLMVTGYTDNVGDANKNLQLSVNRAAFVKTELAKQNIDASKIESNGKGITEPAADNATADGRAKNRRVTIQLQ